MSSSDEQLGRAWKLHQAGQWEQAEQLYREVLGQTPDDPNALCFLGMVCHDTLRFDEALDSYRRALEIKPDFPVALNNRGNTLRSLGRLDEAITTFDFALALQPDYASAHHNLSLALLLKGDWKRGQDEYEWRWRFLGLKEPTFAQPRWDGSELNGKRILLHVEQGLGDTLQFVRFARVAKQRGGVVVVIAQAALLPILRSCPDIDELVAQEQPLPAFETHAPLMSMPQILGVRLETVPGEVPYLSADPQWIESWCRELRSISGLKVGIAWQGNPDNPADRHRSFALSHFEELANVAHVQLVSLQKGPGAEQIKEWHGASPILDFAAKLDEQHGPFMDTAALLKNLDLVIASDSAVAHLAGALGVPIWVILPFAPDWRWMLDRDDNPWYPTMRLFRQSEPGEWGNVFRKVADELQQTAADSARRPLHSDNRLTSTGFNCLNRGRHGLMIYNRHDTYIGKSLDHYGEFSEGEIEIFRQILRPGDVVVEAGANIGAHTVALAKLVGERGAVWAFEPQRIVFQTLCGNLAINSISNVLAKHAALGAEPGTIFVPSLDYNADNNFGGLGLGNYRQGEAVAVETLDALQLPRLNLLKVDVEGMEQKVLQGGLRSLEQHRPILYVENDRREQSAHLIRFLESIGYTMYWHTPPMFRRDNFFGNSKNIFGPVISVNMLCLHNSVGASIQGLKRVAGPESNWQS